MVEPRVSSSERFRLTGMPLFVRRLRRHQAASLHTHECSELVVVLGGRASHRDAAGGHGIRAGDVFVIHPGTRHGYAEVDGLDLVNVVFDRDHFAARLGELRALPGVRVLLDLEPSARRRSRIAPALTLAPAELAEVEPLLTGLQRELTAQRGGYRELATAHFVHLLVVLARAYEARPAASAKRLLRIAAIVRRLEEDPAAPVSVARLAADCGLSPSALIRAFTAAVGTTPIDYVIRQRVRLGAALLRTTGRSVTDIALGVGFGDGNYFSRQFRRVMGTTPRAYRDGS
jgi:AraC-like DNA-binding protein